MAGLVPAWCRSRCLWQGRSGPAYLHPRIPPLVTHRNQRQDTNSNRTKTPIPVTVISKARIMDS
jgi:hypothetical protein